MLYVFVHVCAYNVVLRTSGDQIKCLRIMPTVAVEVKIHSFLQIFWKHKLLKPFLYFLV